MHGSDDASSTIDLVADRLDFLEYLNGNREYKPTIVDDLEHSRSTVDRAIRSLEDENLVERTSDGFATTLKGRLIAEQYRETVSKSADVFDAADALDPLPSTANVSTAAVADAEMSVADGPLPEDPLSDIEQLVEDASRLYGVLPTITDRRLLDGYESTILEDNVPIELIVSEDLIAVFREQYPDRIGTMLTEGEFGLFSGEVPSFGVLLARCDASITVAIIVYDSPQSVHAVLRNDTVAAIQWAKNVYRQHRNSAAVTGDELVADGVEAPKNTGPLFENQQSAGGNQRREADNAADDGESLGIPDRVRLQLANEGIHYLDDRYFQERTAESPLTCWRTGLTHSDVQAGYALDRERPGEDGRRVSVAEEILDALFDGEDSALLGRPGSGKSTVCKMVAVRWHNRGYGPVFCREGGTGSTLESALLLEETLRTLDGHALVVVEDAMRDDANAVFEAMEGFRNDPSVSFLVDSREREWTDPGDPLPNSRLESYRLNELGRFSMPPLDERETARFVDYFEQIADTDVPMSPEQLYSSISNGEGQTSSGPADAMLLVHRLSLVVDPLSAVDTDVPTSFSGVVQRTYNRIRDASNPLTRDIAVVAHLLNLVGYDVRAEYVYAVALESDGSIVDALDQLSRLFVLREGEREDSGAALVYKTGHETWSRAFLTVFLDAEETATARRVVDRGLSAILRLSDDDHHRQRVQWQVSGSTDHLDTIADRPEEWAEDLLVSISKLAQRFPRFLDALGAEGEVGIDVPDVCSWETEVEVLLTRAEPQSNFSSVTKHTLADARAAQSIAAEHDSRTARQYEAEALVKQAYNTYLGGRPSECLELAEEARQMASEHGFEKLAADARLYAAATRTTDENIAELESLLPIYEEESDTYRQIETLVHLIAHTFKRGEFERGNRYLQQHLDLANDYGNVKGRIMILFRVFHTLFWHHAVIRNGGPLDLGLGATTGSNAGRMDPVLETVTEQTPHIEKSAPSVEAFVFDLYTGLVQSAEETDSVDMLVMLNLRFALFNLHFDEIETARDRLEQIDIEDLYHEESKAGANVSSVAAAALAGTHWKSGDRSRALEVLADLEVTVPSARVIWSVAIRGILYAEVGDDDGAEESYQAVIDHTDDLSGLTGLAALERVMILAERLDHADEADELADAVADLARDMGYEGKATAVDEYRRTVISETR